MPEHNQDESPLEQGKRDTQIRRDTNVRGSLGHPSSGTDEAKVTPEGDAFKDQPEHESDRE